VPEIVAEEARRARLEAEAEADSAERERLEEQGKALARWALASEASGRIEATLREAQPELSLAAGALDADPWLLACGSPLPGGAAIDLRTGVARPLRRDDWATRRTAVPWVPGAACPRWRAWIAWAMGSEDPDPAVREAAPGLVAYLQRAVGYSLTTERREKVFFFLYGEKGNNGKSTFLDIIGKLLGDYAVYMPPKLLLESASGIDRHPTELARLAGSRVVLGSDQSGRSSKFNEPLIKQLTGEQKISARRMSRDFEDFDITWKLWLAANNLPYATAGDPTVWARVHCVPFSQHVPPERVDPTLWPALVSELPGILGWAVEGLRAWLAQGLGMPPTVRSAGEAYRRRMDLVERWLLERADLSHLPEGEAPRAPRGEEHGQGAVCLATRAYADFTDWCAAEGVKHVPGLNVVGEELERRGWRGSLETVDVGGMERTRARVRHGLRLLPRPPGMRPVPWEEQAAVVVVATRRAPQRAQEVEDAR
jgi:putative DNA primase/helicase